MHIGTAGSHNHPVKLILFDIPGDHLLPGIGTHIFIGSGKNNIRMT
jgi:hypothetical protein